MTISTNGTGVRPGVCLSTNRPSSPYEGMVIYETDTNRVLVWDNAAWVMIADTHQPPGVQLIKPASVSNGTISGNSIIIGSGVSTVTVSGVFSSEFDNYRVVGSGIDMAGGGTSLFMRFNNSTGSTYSYAGSWREYSNNNFAGTNGAATSNGCWLALTATDNEGCFTADVFNPNVSGYTVVSSWGGYRFYTFWGGGIDTATAVHTGFSLYTTTTMTGGTLRVYGYRN